MDTNTELVTRFDNALGQMSKEINNIFPEGTGYVRIVPLNSATAGGLSIQISNLWSIEIGYLEDEVFDSDHRYILRIDSPKEALVLSQANIAFDLNDDGNVVYANLLNTNTDSHVYFDAGSIYDTGKNFHRNSFEVLKDYSSCSEEQITAFMKKFLMSWNRTLSALRAVIKQAAS